MPIKAGTVTALPSTKISTCAWMWVATPSIVAQEHEGDHARGHEAGNGGAEGGVEPGWPGRARSLAGIPALRRLNASRRRWGAYLLRHGARRSEERPSRTAEVRNVRAFSAWAALDDRGRSGICSSSQSR